MATSITVSGSYDRTLRALYSMQKLNVLQILNKYGQIGVSALSAATPIDSGRAAASWFYKVGQIRGTYFIDWCNGDIENGYPVVIGIQYGHGTGTGGYVQGRDFINPAIRPIFDNIVDEVMRAVTSA